MAPASRRCCRRWPQAYDPELEHYDSQSPVRFNPSCRLVYFDQTMRDLPVDTLDARLRAGGRGLTEKEAIRVLAQAGFPFARLRSRSAC